MGAVTKIIIIPIILVAAVVLLGLLVRWKILKNRKNESRQFKLPLTQDWSYNPGLTSAPSAVVHNRQYYVPDVERGQQVQ